MPVQKQGTFAGIERSIEPAGSAAVPAASFCAPRAFPNSSPVLSPGQMLGWLTACCFVLAVLFAALVRVAHADTLEDETRRIAKQLQCPVCAGAPVSDSPSELAGQMRSVIRARLEAGESEGQIIAYFVERYGDSVLIEPPRRGFGLAVWLAPLGVLAVGGFLLWRLLRAWIRPLASASHLSAHASAMRDPPAEPYRNGTAHAEDSAPLSSVDRARAELDQFRRGG